jgi:hypothetical protein
MTGAACASGLSLLDVDKVELHSRYTPVSASEARGPWQDMFEGTLKTCVHGGLCNLGHRCTQGTRIATVRHVSCTL